MVEDEKNTALILGAPALQRWFSETLRPWPCSQGKMDEHHGKIRSKMNKTTTWSLHWRHWIQVLVLKRSFLIIFDLIFPWIFMHFPSRTRPPKRPFFGCHKIHWPGLRPVHRSGFPDCVHDGPEQRSEASCATHGGFKPPVFWGVGHGVMGFIHWPSQEPKFHWRYRFHICLAYLYTYIHIYI